MNADSRDMLLLQAIANNLIVVTNKKRIDRTSELIEERMKFWKFHLEIEFENYEYVWHAFTGQLFVRFP